MLRLYYLYLFTKPIRFHQKKYYWIHKNNQPVLCYQTFISEWKMKFSLAKMCPVLTISKLPNILIKSTKSRVCHCAGCSNSLSSIILQRYLQAFKYRLRSKFSLSGLKVRNLRQLFFKQLQLINWYSHLALLHFWWYFLDFSRFMFGSQKLSQQTDIFSCFTKTVFVFFCSSISLSIALSSNTNLLYFLAILAGWKILLCSWKIWDKTTKSSVDCNYFVSMRDKPVENTIRLEGALWLNETLEIIVSPLWLAKKMANCVFHNEFYS